MHEADYTLSEVAELTGLTIKAVRSRVDRGSLAHTLRGGQRYVKRTTLIEAGLIAPDPEIPEVEYPEDDIPPMPEAGLEIVPALREGSGIEQVIKVVDALHERLADARIERVRAEERLAAAQNLMDRMARELDEVRGERDRLAQAAQPKKRWWQRSGVNISSISDQGGAAP